MQRLVIVTLCAALLACAHQAPAPPESAAAPPPPPAPAQPGVQPVLDAQATWNDYNCASKKLPFVVIEEDRIVPATPAPGEEFSHRFSYAVCTEQSTPISGVLTRRIYYQNRLVFENKTDDFELRPGKWKVSASIKTSPKAKPGNYDLQLTFSSPVTTITRNLPLVIQK